MIARIWHGWTSKENAAAYEALLRAQVLPGIQRVAGHRGAYLLRREVGAETEFITMTMFESLAAVREFAGPDYERAVILPEAHKLLARFDERSAHYEIVLTPDDR
jgi:heme-degrading monooxygenase HmoA